MDPQRADDQPPDGIATTFHEGDVVAGRYRILRFIALGGMGEVYAAEDPEIGETIALKVIRAEAARDGVALERFRREIQAARRITHPNVGRIFGFEHHRDPDGRTVTFLTMEFLPGETLAERLERGPMPLPEALLVARHVAAALDAAHRSGVVHRDLKPGNVILVPEGGSYRAVVTDLNLAATRGDGGGSHGSRLTQADLVVGTACYMAPEQAQGLDLTGRADLYSFGVVLFEMVTGRLPHEAESAVSLLLKRLQEPPPDPRVYAPGLPEAWSTAILRCLALKPEERFATAGEAVRALESGVPVAVPASASRRRRPLGRWAAPALLLFMALAALWVARPRRWFRGVAPVVEAQLTASQGLDLFPAFSPDGASIVFASNRSGTFQLYRRPAGPSGIETPLTPPGGDDVQPAYSPDGATIVYHSRANGGLWAIPAAGGAPRRLTAFGSRPAFSPDGTTLVFQSEPLIDLSPNAVALPPSTIWSVALAGGAPRELTRAGSPEGGHGSPVFAPDGKTIAFLAADSRNAELWRMNADGTGLVRMLRGVTLVRDPVFSPDGRSLFVCATPEGKNSTLLRYRLDAAGMPAGSGEALDTFSAGKARHLAISHDGKRLLCSVLSVSSNLWAVRVDPATGECTAPPRALTSETGRMTRPDFSPDGLTIAFSRYRAGASDDLFLIGADGTALAQLTTAPAAETWPSWFPDGKRIAFYSDAGGHSAYWVRSLEDGEQSLLFDPGTDFDAPRMSKDGTRVAWNSRRGGRLNVWVADLAAGPSSARQVTFDAELMGWPCWSPDGALLAVQARRGNDTHLALVPSAGGTPEFLVSEPGQTWAGSFSPDGSRIVYAGERGGVWDVYTVSRATKETVKLTDLGKRAGYVRYPTWSPKGDRIAFEYAETAGNVWLLGLP